MYYRVSGSGCDVERAATGSLDNLAIRVAATGSLLLDGIFSLLLVNYNEDVGFFFFGLKCWKAKSGALSKTTQLTYVPSLIAQIGLSQCFWHHFAYTVNWYEGLGRGAPQPRGPPAVCSIRTALLQYTTGYGFV